MGRRPRPTPARRTLSAALLALGLAACNNAYVQVSSGASLPPGPPPAGGSLSATGTSALGALLGLGFANYAMSGGTPFYAPPPMDPRRRVVEQDCTQPIADPGANLRCR